MPKRRVKCQSGLTGWRCRLQENYGTFEEFIAYSDTYALAERLGYKGPNGAWAANPVIEGSVNPSDFRKVRD